MTITDELRKWVHEHVVYGMQTTLEPPTHPLTFGTKEEVLSIADHIDETHKQAVDKAHADGFDEGLARADTWMNTHKEVMAEHGWVRLPVDVDGVPIRVGDRIHNDRDAPVTVDMMAWHDGWDIVTTNGVWIPVVANSKIQHYNAPTVEEVLCEFARRAAGKDAISIRRDLVDDYAKKLQLKEE